jgi:hypothetical protein
MSHAEHGWRCMPPVDEADRSCRSGGNDRGRFLQWYYRPVWIMMRTVTALGPLRLFLVWRTPRLGRTGRCIATGVIVGGTAYLGHQRWQALLVLYNLWWRYTRAEWEAFDHRRSMWVHI